MSKSFSFSIFLNANKKKQFLQTQIFFTTKINPREITEIWPSVKTNPQKKKNVDFGSRENKSTRKLILLRYSRSTVISH